MTTTRSGLQRQVVKILHRLKPLELTKAGCAQSIQNNATPFSSQVLGLYRDCLRVARTKTPDLQADIQRISRQEFREHIDVSKSDIE
jgi:hypothetical protein